MVNLKVIRNIKLNHLTRQILAFLVHILTASGLVFGFLALIAMDRADWKQGFLWLFLCLVIDGIDGSLARKIRAAEVLPSIDGKNIDFVVDFTSYCIVPAYFVYKSELLPEELKLVSILIILISSAFYYGKKSMVVDDQFFEGFPVLWNIVVFVLFFVLNFDPYINFICITFFGIMHFLPIRFAYPSKTKQYVISHLFFSLLGLICALGILSFYPNRVSLMNAGVMICLLYFMVFAIKDTLWKHRL